MTKKIVSILLVFTLAVSLFAGSALAAAGDASGTFADFSYFTLGYASNAYRPQQLSPSNSVTSYFCLTNSGSWIVSRFYVALPYDLQSGICSASSDIINFFLRNNVNGSSHTVALESYFFDYSFNTIGSALLTDSSSFSLPAGTRFIQFVYSVRNVASLSGNPYCVFSANALNYNFSYSSSSGSVSDQEILDGIEAIAQSLYDLETGPYSSTSGVSLNSDGVVTPTTRNDATLETLLNLIGVSSTYSSLAIEQMNLNFGNYFEYHEIEDTSSSTVTVVKSLPSYVNALGMELTDGINKLQRDNLLLYQQGENIEDALYTDKTENQPWSVAQWLKDIYTAITSFFSSFWSPAETDLKTAAEDGMQAAADNGNAASGSQVDEVNSAADAFKSFGSTGNIGSGDVMDIFSDGASYDFFSQTTKDNLAYHPPVGGRRNLRSSSAPSQSDQSEEEYVDELDDKLSYWREVLGLP